MAPACKAAPIIIITQPNIMVYLLPRKSQNTYVNDMEINVPIDRTFVMVPKRLPVGFSKYSLQLGSVCKLFIILPSYPDVA